VQATEVPAVSIEPTGQATQHLASDTVNEQKCYWMNTVTEDV
jgi:hypothetical protein